MLQRPQHVAIPYYRPCDQLQLIDSDGAAGSRGYGGVRVGNQSRDIPRAKFPQVPPPKSPQARRVAAQFRSARTAETCTTKALVVAACCRRIKSLGAACPDPSNPCEHLLRLPTTHLPASVMGLARTPPPGGSERSPSSAPHPSSPSRVRGSAQKTDWTGLPSSAQTALRPPSSVLQPRSTNDLDESDLFARIAPSSSPLKAHVPPPSRPSLDRLAPDSQSLIQSQFRDAPDSQAPEASQNARFGDAAEQRDNSPQHGGNYAADVFGRRPKLARSPPRPVQEEQEDEQQAVEAAQEPQKGGEVSDLMEVDMQGDEALDEALDGVPALTSAEPAVTVPEAPKAERDGGYKGLAKALFGRQGTLPPGACNGDWSLPHVHPYDRRQSATLSPSRSQRFEPCPRFPFGDDIVLADR